jgi:Holliday junction resolvase RusA-like endonuclease
MGAPGELEVCNLCGGRPFAEVAASWTMRIDRDAPTQNVTGNNRGGGRWAYKAERRAWFAALAAKKSMQRIATANVKRRVIITRCYSGQQKLRDHGNLVGGLKPAVDAMVGIGLLKDDSPEFCEIYYHQRRVEKSERGTLITIEELS